MANVTLSQVHAALWNRVSSMEGYATKSLKWTDYVSAKQGRPALFMTQTSMTAINNPVGLPSRYQLLFEVWICLDKKKFPEEVGDEMVLIEQDKLIQALAPEKTNAPGDECCHLDLGKGWVMHAWLTQTEFYAAMQEVDDMVSAVFTIEVLCATRLATP